MSSKTLSFFITSLLLSSINAESYIIKFKDTQKNLEFIASQKGVDKITPIASNLVSMATIEIDSANKSMINIIQDMPEVEYIEKSMIYSALPVFETPILDNEKSDSLYPKQWGLKNTGKNSGGWFFGGKKGEDVNAEKAWAISKGSKDLIVAVIDTGIDYNHKDLKGNMFANEAELNGQEGIDDDGNGFVDDIYGYDFANNDGDPMDGNSHGTHCAGVIGATHDTFGTRGVMANVKLIGVKFLTDSGSGTTENAIKAISYAVSRGAKVLSNSWGGGERSQALFDVIKAANDQGVVFVAAAGNSSANNDSRPSWPANYKIDNVINVGSHDGKGKKSSFSNYGKKTVHVMAPGSGILSTTPNNRHRKLSGTSMATPFVAGAIGLLLSTTDLTPLQVRNRVINSATKTPNLKKYSQSGRLNAYELLQ